VEVISEINDETRLNVGNLVRIRIELRADRPMEFVAYERYESCWNLEPIHVLFRYKWQDGLGSMRALKMPATISFLHYLPKGVYVSNMTKG